MKKISLSSISILLVGLLSANLCGLMAQGDGPRSFLLSPKGVWGVVPKGLFLNQNLIPAGNILVQDANISVTVFPTTFFHTFGIKDRWAQVLFMINPGSATASLDPNMGFPSEEINANGLSDGFFGIKVGLVGAPALDINQFAKHSPAFSLSGYFRIWYSGSYEASKLFNLGTNRLAFQIGAPMAIPLSKNTKRMTWLEVYPSLQFYTDNNDPARSSRAQKTEQKPLFLIENHLTHNFTSKFWAGIDLGIQYGGKTIVDEVPDDNKQQILAGSISLGYQILPFLAANTSYGGILFGDKDARSEMFRVSLLFTYINLKKYQASDN